MIMNLNFKVGDTKLPLINVKDGYNKVTVNPAWVLFFDVETVPAYNSLQEFEQNDPAGCALFRQKMQSIRLMTPDENERTMSDEDFYLTKAGLYAEYNKIVCISVGGEKNGKFNVFSLASDDEKQLLVDFVGFVNSKAKEKPYLCGHNIDNFDCPMIARKCIYHGILPPATIMTWDEKPWDRKTIDTIGIARFTGSSGDARLVTLSKMLGLVSPKDILGDTGHLQLKKWQIEGNYEKIAEYCEGDVNTVYKIFIAVQNLNVVEPKQ